MKPAFSHIVSWFVSDTCTSLQTSVKASRINTFSSVFHAFANLDEVGKQYHDSAAQLRSHVHALYMAKLTISGCLDYIVYLWVQRVCQVLFTWFLSFKAHGPPPVKNMHVKLYILDLFEPNQSLKHWRELNALYSPQVLTVEISCTGAMFPGSFILDVPGQKLHHVVGGTKASLALNGLGRANGEVQGWTPKTKTHTDPFSVKNESHSTCSTPCNILYLYETHSRGRGCSRSGTGRCCRPLLSLCLDCTGPIHTAVHCSTPRP